uniref:HTH_Tnp_Tc3_2 domain-containing protein n=1 Tax=Haemonchus contortus TaxID=6289 RepID=A0A7I5EEC8_HAECO
MGRGSLLSDSEKKEQGLSNRRIARDLGRSHTVVDNFIKNPEEHGTRRSAGRPSLLSDRDKRRILREASNSTKSCMEIRSSLNLNASKDTVWRVIRKSQFIVKRKMRKAPFMTKKHRENRVAFARRCSRTEWNKVFVMC